MSEKKHYLMFCSLAYAFPILRPIQEEIRRRGDECAWFIEKECPNLLNEDELQLYTSDEVKDYNPIAVFVPGNWVYDWFPGVKVQVFHGYPINKRGDKVDDHFRMRGWFDIYCTSGPTSTPTFKQLSESLGYFKVYETGWCKVDSLVTPLLNNEKKDRKTVFVATTFSKDICALNTLYPTIKKLATEKDWDWIITMHPKLQDYELEKKYRLLERECPNVSFTTQTKVKDMQKADVMLCDSSSIIVEFMILDKPVVTYRNTNPGPQILNVLDIEEIEDALEIALRRPDELMQNIHEYTSKHEAHRDGKNCSRILDAVDDFILNYKGRLKSKPLNLIRRIKLRLKQM